MAAALLLALAAVIFFPGVFLNYLDEMALQRQASIPSGFKRVEYHGFPLMSGFGQREGLTVSAVYELTARQKDRFIKNAPSQGWKALPFPREIKERIPFKGLSVPLDAPHGLFICRTAGNDVLHSRKLRELAHTEPTMVIDLVIAVYDLQKNRLYAEVRSCY